MTGVLVLTTAAFLIGAAVGSSGSETAATQTVATTVTETVEVEPDVASGFPEEERAERPREEEEPAAEREPAAEGEPDMTSGQRNALRSAKSYLDTVGMSKSGLIEQLTSIDGFSKADATWAANHVDADWNQEAVESAKSYLDTVGMSKSGLIEQLTSIDRFTDAQARYAANKVY